MSPLVDEFTSMYKHALINYMLPASPFYINEPINKPVITFNPAVNVTHKKCIKDKYGLITSYTYTQVKT